MKKRIILLFLFISSCGYTPINSLNNKDYSIISFKLNGNNQINRIIDRQSIQEKATPEDILNICKLLLSSKAKDITGQTINVKGV